MAWSPQSRLGRLWRLAFLGVTLVAPSLASTVGTPITIQLKWHHQFQFAGYYAAEAQGYYRAAGLDVRIKEGAPNIEPVDEVLSGRAQFGITDASLLLARAEGKPVVAVGVVFQHSAAVLLLRRLGSGKGLEDLAGKRVMLSVATEADILAFLHANALPPERLVVVPHSFDLQDLIQGRVVAMSGYATNEPYYLDQAGFPYQIYSTRSAGIDFYGDTLFTDEKELRAQPAAVKAFRAASMRGWQYAMAHQEETADLILSRYSQRKNRAQLLFEASQMVPLLQPELVEMGYMNPERWKKIGDTFVQLGMLRKGFSLEGFLYKPKPDMDFQGLLRWLSGLIVLAVAVLAYQIHRAKSNFQAIFNSTNDAIFIHDLASGAILAVNQSATEMYGYSRDEIPGLPFNALCGGVPPYSPEDAMGWLRKAAAGPPQVFEWLAKHRSGRLFWVEVSMRRATINGHWRLIVVIRDSAERKRAEEALEKSEKNLRKAQQVAHVGSWTWNIKEDRVEWSDEMYRIFGIDKAGFQGVLSEVIARAIHPEDRAAVEQSNRSVIQQGVPVPLEYRVIRPDGSVRVVWAEAGEIILDEDGSPAILSGIVQDISERKRAEATLRESEERFRSYMLNAPIGVFECDEKGRYLLVNPASCRITGYSREELLRMSIPDLLPEAEWQNAGNQFQRLLETGYSYGELMFRRKDDTVGIWSVEAVRLSADRFLGFTSDISERRREDQLRTALQAQLFQSQKMESLGGLAGGVAHDMNNVLGAILALASVHLASLPKDSALYPSLETIRDAATRGGDMVKRLLAFSRQTPSENRALDLNALIRETARLLEHTTLAKVRVGLELAPDLQPVLGDASALTHAFMNLSVNAVDAMPDGGSLIFRTRNLDPEQVEVSVEDNGSGMTREVLDRAMDPFFTTKAVGKGTGLGLSLVFTTVNAHGGQLTIHSEPGQGTRVAMSFPAMVGQAPGPGQEDPVRPDKEEPSIQVLLVDDDELIQRSTQMLVEALGHKVASALSGEAALALLEQGFRPDVVILDMNMPGLGGKATLPRLRALCPTVPVLLATGRVDQEALDLVASQPFVIMMSKPFSFEDLQGHLQRISPQG